MADVLDKRKIKGCFTTTSAVDAFGKGPNGLQIADAEVLQRALSYLRIRLEPQIEEGQSLEVE
jgi:hypothetical protein